MGVHLLQRYSLPPSRVPGFLPGAGMRQHAEQMLVPDLAVPLCPPYRWGVQTVGEAGKERLWVSGGGRAEEGNEGGQGQGS